MVLFVFVKILWGNIWNVQSGCRLWGKSGMSVALQENHWENNSDQTYSYPRVYSVSQQSCLYHWKHPLKTSGSNSFPVRVILSQYAWLRLGNNMRCHHRNYLQTRCKIGPNIVNHQLEFNYLWVGNHLIFSTIND